MKKKLLPKRLKHYAALAASAIASEASSQVVYTNMADTTLVNNGDFFDISLNNDGVMEVRLSISKYTSTNGPIYVRRSSAGAEALNFADINMTMVSTERHHQFKCKYMEQWLCLCGRLCIHYLSN